MTSAGSLVSSILYIEVNALSAELKDLTGESADKTKNLKTPNTKKTN
jgi:hypothetical protein